MKRSKRLPNRDLIGREVTVGLSRGKGRLTPIKATVARLHPKDPTIVCLSNGRYLLASDVRNNTVPVQVC
jgi:hypothetical protein